LAENSILETNLMQLQGEQEEKKAIWWRDAKVNNFIYFFSETFAMLTARQSLTDSEIDVSLAQFMSDDFNSLLYSKRFDQ
jgi:hypothetical protein